MSEEQVLPGRPRLPSNLKKKGIYLKLSPWVINWLQSQSRSQGILVEEALIEVNKLKKPDDLAVDNPVYKYFFKAKMSVYDLAVENSVNKV